MKTNKINFVRCLGLLFIVGAMILSSCVKEEEIATSREISTIKTGVGEALQGRKGDEVLKEMKALSDALHKINTGTDTKQSSNAAIGEFSVPPPYYAGNSGTVSKNRNFNEQFISGLSFGNRAPEHNTQWIAMDLSDMITWTDAGSGASNHIGRGSVTYSLYGVGQSVTLDYQINPPAAHGVRTITVTPSSSAKLIRNDVVPSPILLGGGPIKMIIHASEFGYLWLRLEHNGLIRYDQLYSFNYSSNLDNVNGGAVLISGYNLAGGPSIPYSFFSAEHRYIGYCGWFKG
jgi:hypothetical protein